MKKFLFWFAVAERRQAETHLIILDSVQKKLEFQPKGTAFATLKRGYGSATLKLRGSERDKVRQ